MAIMSKKSESPTGYNAKASLRTVKEAQASLKSLVAKLNKAGLDTQMVGCTQEAVAALLWFWADQADPDWLAGQLAQYAPDFDRHYGRHLAAWRPKADTQEGRDATESPARAPTKAGLAAGAVPFQRRKGKAAK